MATLNKRATRCPRAAESDKFPEALRQLLYGKGRNKPNFSLIHGSRPEPVGTNRGRNDAIAKRRKRSDEPDALTGTSGSVKGLGGRPPRSTRPTEPPVIGTKIYGLIAIAANPLAPLNLSRIPRLFRASKPVSG